MTLRLTRTRAFRLLGLLAFFLSTGSLSLQSKIKETAQARDSEVRIGVFGLFHPRHLRVTAAPGSALMLQSGDQQILLESSAGTGAATISKTGSGVLVTTRERKILSSAVLVSGRNGDPVEFQLAVPGKIARRYRGTLEIRASTDELIPVVAMDLETAVAAVVAAESLPDRPLEALKAQAVATRSYLVSGRGRHPGFDFCDTTHCQFLREPPAPGSAIARAVIATAAMVLAYESKPFPAMYTRACSGQTRTPAQVGLSSVDYPYYSVHCEYCRSHPARWTSRIASSDARSLRSSDEASRLAVGRRLGWSVVASNDFIVQKEGDETLLQGTGQGHGIGLCQAGATAMAERGAGFYEILSHYYPNTSIVTWGRERALAAQSVIH